MQKEYDITEHILNLLEQGNMMDNMMDNMMGKVRQKMNGIKDIDKANRQIIMKKISPKMIYQVFENLHRIQEIYDYLKMDETIMNYLDNKNISLHCQTLIDFLIKNLKIAN